MSEQIILAKDTGSVHLDVGADALCVRHRTYAAPECDPGARHVTFEELAADPRGLMASRSVLVMVGLNKAMTPANRTAEVFEVLFNLSDDWHKVSVDRTLFVVEPWRAWFHFGLVGAEYREYTYSYLAESHWRAYQDGVRAEDPFSLAEIVEHGRGVVRSTYREYFAPTTVERIEVSAEVHAAYQDLKERCFAEEHTLPAIVRRLAMFAQGACPRRAIPTPARLFDLPISGLLGPTIVHTDLRVDEFLVGRLLGLVELTNAIGRSFHHDS